MSDKENIVTFKCDKDLHISFKKVVKGNDQTMSVVLRQAMRDYIKKHGQGDLFTK